MTSNGEVLPIGDSLVLVALESSVQQRRFRLRTLMMRQPAPSHIHAQHRFGIISGISPADGEPTAARMFMRRISPGPPDQFDTFLAENVHFLTEEDLVKKRGRAWAENILRVISNRQPGDDHVLKIHTDDFAKEFIRLPSDEAG